MVKHLDLQAADGCVLHAALLDASPAAEADDAPLLVLLHGGGPDHHSLLPLARRLAGPRRIALPDVRGYGHSVCRDPGRHTWAQYVDDLVALLHRLDAPHAIVGGTGLGATIALRAALDHPERVHALVLVSVEDIEDDDGKRAETAMLDAFAERARTHGLAAAWQPVLARMPPVIGAMVRDAMPRSAADSIAAAGAIGRDRAFNRVEDLAAIVAPALLVAGGDARHPRALAEALARQMPRAQLSLLDPWSPDVRDADDLGRLLAPGIESFLRAQRCPPR